MLFRKPGSAIGRLSNAGGNNAGAYLVAANSSFSGSCSYPLGIEAGDLILAFSGKTDGIEGGISTPSGFTLITSASALADRASAFQKIATGSESGSLNVGGANRTNIAVFRDHDGVGGYGGATGGAGVDLPLLTGFVERPSLFAYGLSRVFDLVSIPDPSVYTRDLRDHPSEIPFNDHQPISIVTRVPVSRDPADVVGLNLDYRVEAGGPDGLAIVAVQVLSR